MFAVIYSFKVKEGLEATFQNAWRELTELVHQYEGGLGSRLHKKNESLYIAYAQWPDYESWQKAGKNLPESSNKIRKILRDSCEQFETLYELDVVEDLLKEEAYSE
ncbi:antibiotic biosynthesis monooxygenase [Mangrovimonas sp. YM274]|uniref:antibiotic biosynthesis monooxygenase family protein n=1 Tax=Mangrovimonas sp. YM274 TaxID=3070660 RepID=UPI0027DC4A6D|nr:antibiotic biosynthesis monooxygenase family protein [Mangrovimonas sp. YM274]WMI70149.1 antibiotic biosynthesis monooxygenase family protein [Mangrovimonas sp. YM274]